MPPRLFVGHSISKGKAAMTVKPRAPEFSQSDPGAYKLSKEGFLLRQFATAAVMRVYYDWSKKQDSSGHRCINREKFSRCRWWRLVLSFSLALEISVNSSMTPSKEEGIQNKLLNLDERIYILVTKAEFIVLVSDLNFILLYLISWYAFSSTVRLEDAVCTNNNASPRYGGNYEWNGR